MRERSHEKLMRKIGIRGINTIEFGRKKTKANHGRSPHIAPIKLRPGFDSAMRMLFFAIL